MAELKVWIHVRETPSSQVETFGPGQELPDWVLERIEGKDHLFKEIDQNTKSINLPAPRATDDEDRQEAQVKAEAKGEVPEEEDEDEALEPPKRNASEADWREFLVEARESGEYPLDPDEDYEKMDRTQLIKTAEEAGVIEPK